MHMQFEAETDIDKSPTPLMKKPWFWMRVMPGILTALLIMIGIIMVVRYRHVAVYFEVRGKLSVMYLASV